jgi:HD-like signal output (HDOD) protein
VRVASAAYYSRGAPLRSAREALVRAGAQRVRDLVMTAVFVGMFDTRNSLARDACQHAVACGQLAGFLARETKKAEPGEAGLVGLMHDVGQLLFVQSGDFDYRQFGIEDGQLSGSAHRIERIRLGYDHAVLGELALRLWNFPADLATAVGMHHYETLPKTIDGRLRSLVHITRVADLVDSAIANQRPLEHVVAAIPSSSDVVSADDIRRLWPDLLEVRAQALDLFG